MLIQYSNHYKKNFNFLKVENVKNISLLSHNFGIVLCVYLVANGLITL